jgi:hypothetical protein
MSSPERMAEMGAGAEGCASGRQAWKFVVLKAISDKGIRGDRGDLHKKVDIEQVGHENKPVHPHHHHQEEGVIIGFGAIVIHVVDRKQTDTQRNKRYGHQHEQAETIDRHPNIERFAKPVELPEDGTLADPLPAAGDGKNEKEEEDGVGQKVGQEFLRYFPYQGQDGGCQERHSNKKENQRSSSISLNTLFYQQINQGSNREQTAQTPG